MQNKKNLLIRLIVLGIVLVIAVAIVATKLVDLQLVNGAEYAMKSERRLTSSENQVAPRGEILDRYGRPLVTNRSAFSISIDYKLWDFDNQNDIILEILELLDKYTITREESLPITMTQPYYFTAQSAEASEMKALNNYTERQKWGTGLTAEEIIPKLKEKFEISDKYTEQQARRIINIRYDMIQKSFSTFNKYTFASDIPIDLVSEIKEQHKNFPGVDIAVLPVREYKTTLAPHIIGRVGPIYKEEWEENRDSFIEKGYKISDSIGKDGMEKYLEQYLKGTDGITTVEVSAVEGQDAKQKIATQAGKNCILTLDLALQQVAEESLARTLESLPNTGGGAAVVVDVNTGEILAAANYPTYNLETFSKDYNKLLEDPLKPMLNRSFRGAYAPGSTYKIITALAGLEEGVINENTKVYCSGVYQFFNYNPRCWKRSGHGTENVTTAIRDSCNIFFYETGRLLGAEKMEQYAKSFGLGEKTGVELSEEKGMVAGPTNTEKLRKQNPAFNAWMPGNTLQAAIGQSDHQYTPIQLASYIATFVNGGTRYKTHLLKSVKEADYSETYLEIAPEILGNVEISDKSYDLIMKGMNDVTREGGTAASIFRNYPVSIGGKSGTAQLGGGKVDNGLFVAFAPFENPEIAVCVVGEGADSGSNVAPVVRDIFDAYFGNSGEMENVQADYSIIR